MDIFSFFARGLKNGIPLKEGRASSLENYSLQAALPQSQRNCTCERRSQLIFIVAPTSWNLGQFPWEPVMNTAAIIIIIIILIIINYMYIILCYLGQTYPLLHACCTLKGVVHPGPTDKVSLLRHRKHHTLEESGDTAMKGRNKW